MLRSDEKRGFFLLEACLFEESKNIIRTAEHILIVGISPMRKEKANFC